MAAGITVLAIILLQGNGSAEPENLVLNPGFEDWDQTAVFPEYWDVGTKWEAPDERYPMGDPSAVARTTLAHSGNFSIRFTFPGYEQPPGPPDGGYSIIKQDIYGIIPGAKYNFSFWYKLSFDSTGNRAYIWWIGETGSPLGSPAIEKVMDPGPVDYTKFDGVTSRAPRGAIAAQIQFGRYGWNSMYIDDVLFTVIPPINHAPQMTPTGDQISNEGTAVSVQVIASDPDDDTLTFTASDLPVGLTIDANGVISGTLGYDTAGAYTASITVTDPSGLTDSKSFSWTVHNINLEGNISITSSPSSAEVLVDGASKGTAPLTIPNVAPGSHAIKCKLSGYSDYDTTATVTAGATTSVTCSMPQSQGNISITSSPTGAEVFVDGASKGTAPLTIPNLAPGSHVVKCKLFGYANYDTTATVTAGSISSVICYLVKEGELSVKLTSEPSSIQSGQISTIKITVTKDGAPLSGVNVMLSSTPSIKFSPSSGTTTNGEFISTFTPSTEGEIKVSALAKKEGINDGKGEIVVQVGKITPTPTTPAGKQATITGKVMDANTGDPVFGATVSIGSKSDTTGSDGKYELKVNTGDYNNITVTRPEYEAMTKSVNVPEEGTDVDFLIKPIPIISWSWILIILLIVVIVAGSIYFNKKRKHVPTKCPKCSAKVVEGTRFCEECGEPF
jgi:hypothetical protein